MALHLGGGGCFEKAGARSSTVKFTSAIVVTIATFLKRLTVIFRFPVGEYFLLVHSENTPFLLQEASVLGHSNQNNMIEFK